MRIGAMQNIEEEPGWVGGARVLFAENNDPRWCRASCRPIPAYPSVHLGTSLLRFNLIISSTSGSIISINISISFNLISISISFNLIRISIR